MNRSVRTSVLRTYRAACLAFALSLILSPIAVADDGGSSKRQYTGVKVELLAGKPQFLNWVKSEKDARAIVLCLHELGMHKGVFENLGSRLANDGYNVYSMDLRGFGDWHNVEGKEGRMDLDNTLADIKEACQALHKKHPTLPVFVLGEAMGGALALKAASTFPDLIQGTISSCPGGEHFKTTKNYLTVCKKLLTKGPNKRFAYGDKLVEMATPKKELQDHLKNDPEVRLDLAPRELMACQFFMYKTSKFARKIDKSPVLIVQGQRDGESKPRGAVKVFKNLSTRDKELLELSDGDHYVYQDSSVADDAYKRTVAWINEHLPRNVQ